MDPKEIPAGKGQLRETMQNQRNVPQTTAKLVAVPNIKFAQPKLPRTGPKLSPIDTQKTAPTSSVPIQKPLRSANTNPDTPNATMQTEYNVYAITFVPDYLRQINHDNYNNIINTKPKHRIDYPAYIHTFAAKSFLPERPRHPAERSTPHAPSAAILSENHYLEQLTEFWRIENQAKEQENNRFALYKAHLHRVHLPDGQSLFRLSIPGLREENPRVEMGDVLQLRQIWVDKAGNLQLMSRPYGDPRYNKYVTSSWAGIQCNASIFSIKRADDTVYLKAEGVSEHRVGSFHLPIFVNVVFPLNQRVIETHHEALAFVDRALKNINRLRKSVNGSVQLSEIPLQSTASFSIPDSTSKAINHLSNGNLSISDQSKTENPPNSWIRSMLFPVEADGRIQTQLRSYPDRKLFDVLLNYEQAHSVNSVCLRDYGTLPYLISGPPGTGKTKSLVEIAMQLLNAMESNHILICAPSDPAADTLALRLKKYLTPKQLLRLNGPWRADNEVPQELIQYSYMEQDMFYLPPFPKLMAYNVVVTSCRDATMLASARLTNTDLWSIEKNMLSTFHPEDRIPPPSLHWDALLVDEAAQATELDVLPPLTVVCPPSEYPEDMPQPRFVMAGDENQLGPRTASRDPRFSTSLFARLFDRSVYKDHPLSRSKLKPSTGPPVLKRSMLPILYSPFTNLVRNYRSHPSILSVPSTLFYNDTLIPEAPIPDTPLQRSSLWRGRKWPILFISGVGNDEIEREGGGWFNLSEARIACDIAQRLIFESGVIQSDICIMSPFAAQVKRLRTLIRSKMYGGGRGFYDVNIGPLEAFQGLEKRVVILCTTRARDRFREEDAKRGLGIIHQPRKMNVALTRAKEALVVIGSGPVLSQDEHWKQWLAFCERNGLVWNWGGALNAADGRGMGYRFEREKVGVLEKALSAKEDKSKNSGETRLLGKKGAAGAEYGASGGYEAWLDGLREEMEEEEARKEEEEGEEGEDEDVEEENGDEEEGEVEEGGRDYDNGDLKNGQVA